jgi:hypothetical protein
MILIEMQCLDMCLLVAPLAALVVTFRTLKLLPLAVHCLNMFGQVTSSRCAEIANVTNIILLLEMHCLDM